MAIKFKMMKYRQNMSNTLLLSNPKLNQKLFGAGVELPYHKPTSQEHDKALMMMSGVFTTVLRLEHPRSSSFRLALW